MSVAIATEDVHSCVLTHMTVTIAHVAKVSKLTENAGVAQVSLSYVLFINACGSLIGIIVCVHGDVQ